MTFNQRETMAFNQIECLGKNDIVLFIYKIRPGLSQVYPSRPGSGSAGSHWNNSHVVFCLNSALPQTRVGRVPD
jgi:hypothetical protein